MCLPLPRPSPYPATIVGGTGDSSEYPLAGDTGGLRSRTAAPGKCQVVWAGPGETMGWISKFRRRDVQDRGAQLVEFALLAPLLILLLLGIIEFGYVLGERNEVKHGVHEGARLAAVNDSAIITNACTAMQLSGTSAAITLVDGTTSEAGAADGVGAIGDQASVTVTATISSLSGLSFIEVFLPTSISTTAEFRLEQPSDWSSAGPTSC